MKSLKNVMVEKQRNPTFFFEKIVIFGQNGSFFTYKLPKNTLLQVKKTNESVCETVQGSGRSPKKVMVEK